MAEFISIAAFNDHAPAHALAYQLEQAGINAEVYDESTEQKWHLFQISPHAHMRVRVPDTEVPRALDLLRTWEGHDAALDQAVHCPSCKSTQVEFPQFSRRTLVGALPALAAAAGIIERDYFCEACQFTWPAEKPEAEPEVDVLNWPVRKP